MSEDWDIQGIPVGQLETAIKSIAQNGYSVEVRRGLTVDTTFGESVVLVDGKRYEKKDIPPGIESELIAAANRHNKAIRHLKNSKYLHPETNPLIKI